jgi:son of sevenless-like protein
MLMTLRTGNGTFPDPNIAQQPSFNSYSARTLGPVAETVVQYTEEASRQQSTIRSRSDSTINNGVLSETQKSRAAGAGQRRSPPLMNGLLTSAPQPVMYVRALYDYEADDRTSLSFHEGDVIQVITQLESGWWDGVINNVRGWFPSNYCQVIAGPEDTREHMQMGTHVEIEEEEIKVDDDEQEEYTEEYEDEGDSEAEGLSHLPMEGTSHNERTRADFWIPQATPDGRLFYFNTETGESSMELPLESPSSATENGPRNRMNVNIPDKTRPPAELMAQGYTQNEDDDSEGNSASELEGESLMLASSSSYHVSHLEFWCSPNINLILASKETFGHIRWHITCNIFGFY